MTLNKIKPYTNLIISGVVIFGVFIVVLGLFFVVNTRLSKTVIPQKPTSFGGEKRSINLDFNSINITLPKTLPVVERSETSNMNIYQANLLRFFSFSTPVTKLTDVYEGEVFVWQEPNQRLRISPKNQLIEYSGESPSEEKIEVNEADILEVVDKFAATTFPGLNLITTEVSYLNVSHEGLEVSTGPANAVFVNFDYQVESYPILNNQRVSSLVIYLDSNLNIYNLRFQEPNLKVSSYQYPLNNIETIIDNLNKGDYVVVSPTTNNYLDLGYPTFPEDQEFSIIDTSIAYMEDKAQALFLPMLVINAIDQDEKVVTILTNVIDFPQP